MRIFNPNISKLLVQRQIHGQTILPQSWLQKQAVNYNLRNDQFQIKSIHCNVNARKHACAGNLLAVIDKNNQLSLYDIQQNKKLWTINVNYINSHPFSGYILKEYLCVNLDKVLFITAPIKEDFMFDPHFQIFLNGATIGSFSIRAKYCIPHSFMLIHDHIYGINGEKNQFCIWDTAGNRIKSINLDSNLNLDGIRYGCYTRNQNYYIAAFNCANIGISIFIFNLTTNEYIIHNINNSNNEITFVDSTSLSGKTIFFSTHSLNKLTNELIKINIYSYDIETNQFQIQLTKDKVQGRIFDIILNDNLMIYSLYQRGIYKSLFCTYKSNYICNKIKSISIYAGIFLTDNLLTIIDNIANSELINRTIMDLNDCNQLKPVQNITYKHCVDISYPNNRLVMFNAKKNQIIIEDFNHIHHDPISPTQITARIYKKP